MRYLIFIFCLCVSISTYAIGMTIEYDGDGNAHGGLVFEIDLGFGNGGPGNGKIPPSTPIHEREGERGHQERPLAEGFHTHTYPSGATYSGDYKQGVMHGFGQITFPSGFSYKGEFINGQADGAGEMRWPDGGMHKGRFYQSKPHGRGRYQSANGDFIESDWQDGKAVGEVFISRFGGKTHFIGTLNTDGKPDDAWSIWTHANGKSYSGQWTDGLPNGEGTFNQPGKVSYKGGWKNGKHHGLGEKVNSRGDVLNGNFVKGEPHGNMKIKFANGIIGTIPYTHGEVTGPIQMTSRIGTAGQHSAIAREGMDVLALDPNSLAGLSGLQDILSAGQYAQAAATVLEFKNLFILSPIRDIPETAEAVQQLYDVSTNDWNRFETNMRNLKTLTRKRAYLYCGYMQSKTKGADRNFWKRLKEIYK